MAVLRNGVKMGDKQYPAYPPKKRMPVSRKSVVSFVDILGYSEKVKKAADEGKTDQLLYYVQKALYSAFEYIEAEAPCFALNFSDSVVMGWPIDDVGDGEVPLCISCWDLATYQLTMSQFGLFVRGGVDVGEAYFDEYVQLGHALLGVYETEELYAVYPRIILSDNAIAVAKECCSVHNDKSCALNTLFAVDADGSVFVNYLSAVFEIFDVDTGKQDIEECLITHKDAIERNLIENAKRPYVYRKYQWAARYHDFFCEEISDWLEDDLSIVVEYGKERLSPPRKLLDVYPGWVS